MWIIVCGVVEYCALPYVCKPISTCLVLCLCVNHIVVNVSVCIYVSLWLALPYFSLLSDSMLNRKLTSDIRLYLSIYLSISLFSIFLYLSFSLTHSPTVIYVSIYLSIYLSLFLSHLLTHSHTHIHYPTLLSTLVTAGQLATYDQAKELVLATGFMEDGIATHFASSLLAVRICMHEGDNIWIEASW